MIQNRIYVRINLKDMEEHKLWNKVHLKQFCKKCLCEIISTQNASQPIVDCDKNMKYFTME